MSQGATASAVFAALGDETRLRIVGRLCKSGPQSTLRLAEGEAVTRQAVEKHLVLLAEAGLVSSSREGRARIWELEPRRILVAQRYLEQVSSRWDAAIERLRDVVEEDD